MILYRIGLVASLLALLPACLTDNGGVITGNGLLGVAVSSAESPVRPVVSRFEVLVDEIALDADGPAGSISIAHELVSLIDVISGVETPPLTPIVLSEGTYTSVGFALEIRDDGPDLALLLEGTLDGTPVRFEFDSAESFERSTSTLFIPAGLEQIVEYEFDTDAWFVDVEAASLTLDGNGVAIISATSNTDAYDTIVDALDATTDATFP